MTSSFLLYQFAVYYNFYTSMQSFFFNNFVSISGGSKVILTFSMNATEVV